MYAPKPERIQIADSLSSAETLKAEVTRYPLSKFKCEQTKMYKINQVLTGQSSFIPIQYGGRHTCLAYLTINSTLVGLNFIAVAPPPKKKPVETASTKKRVLYSASDDDSSSDGDG